MLIERVIVVINIENKVLQEKMEYLFVLWNNLSVEDKILIDLKCYIQIWKVIVINFKVNFIEYNFVYFLYIIKILLYVVVLLVCILIKLIYIVIIILYLELKF